MVSFEIPRSPGKQFKTDLKTTRIQGPLNLLGSDRILVPVRDSNVNIEGATKLLEDFFTVFTDILFINEQPSVIADNAKKRVVRSWSIDNINNRTGWKGHRTLRGAGVIQCNCRRCHAESLAGEHE